MAWVIFSGCIMPSVPGVPYHAWIRLSNCQIKKKPFRHGLSPNEVRQIVLTSGECLA
jgi:hypothetical protein